MESVLVKVVSFIAVIVVGYLLKRVGFFRAEDFRLIAGLVLKVTLPCAIISNFTRIDVDAALFVLVLLGLGCNLVTVAAGWLASKRGDSAEQAFNIINFRATTSAASLFLFCRAS
ncbi:MAG: AEC family transporter [Sutterella wadsworthensis]